MSAALQIPEQNSFEPIAHRFSSDFNQIIRRVLSTETAGIEITPKKLSPYYRFTEYQHRSRFNISIFFQFGLNSQLKNLKNSLMEFPKPMPQTLNEEANNFGFVNEEKGEQVHAPSECPSAF